MEEVRELLVRREKVESDTDYPDRQVHTQHFNIFKVQTPGKVYDQGMTEVVKALAKK